MITRLHVLAFLLIPALAWAKLPPRVQIASVDEPGQRLIVTGRVFVFDAGGRPLRVTLTADQADARGLYNRPWSFRREPRLRGKLLTAADGSYEIDTIKPGVDPNHNTPAQIHIRLRNVNEKIDQELEIRFEGNGPAICNATADANGVLRCAVDFHLHR